MAAYDNYLAGNLVDLELAEEELDAARAVLDGLPAIG